MKNSLLQNTLKASIAMIVCLFFAQAGFSQILFSEDFDGISGPTGGGPGTYAFPSGWLKMNVDNRAPNGAVSYVNEAWERREDFANNVADSAAFSTSWTSPTGQGDDWMWTPAITLTGSNINLSWNALAYDPAYPDGYEVRIMVDPTVPSGSNGVLGNMVSASTLLFSVGAENTTWTPRSISLAAYAGQTVRIAFRNHSTDMFLLLIDDIIVENLCTLPTIACGGNLTVGTDAGVCSATITNAQLLGQITSSGGDPVPSITFSPAAGTFLPGTTLVTATASNGCGADATCTFNVIVADDENPTAACQDVTVDLVPLDETIYSIASLVSGGGASITSLANGAAASMGDIIILGGTSRLVNNVRVAVGSIGSLAPFDLTLNIYSDCSTNGSANSPCGNGTGTLLATQTLTGLVLPSAFTYYFVDFSFSNLDLSGEVDNTISVVLNTTNPDVIWPVDCNPGIGSSTPFATRCGSVAANNGCGRNFATTNAFYIEITATSDVYGASVDGGDIDNGSTDNCGIVDYSVSPSDFTCGEVGANTVTLTVTDGAGNTSSCNATVTVQDVDAPVITCPGDVTVDNDLGVCGAVVNFAATATDNCSATITYDPASGSTFPIGTTTVTATAEDPSGNQDVCTFTVTVNDTEAPTFLGCLQNITVSNEAGICSAVVTYPTFGETLTGSGNIQQEGNNFENGNVSNTAWIGTGGVSSDDIFIPAGQCYDISTIAAPFFNNDLASVSAITVTFYSDASGAPGSVVSTQTLLPGDWTTTLLGTNFFGFINSNQYDLTLNTPITLCGGGSGTTYWMSIVGTVVDGFDFYWEYSTVSPYGDNAMFFNPSAGEWVPLGGNLVFDIGYSYSFATGVTDNCPGVVIDYSIASGSTFPIGTTAVTITATDVAGNSSNCVFNVVVEDTEDPTITCPNDTVVDNNPGDCGAVITFNDATSTDNCLGETITYSVANGSFFPVGTTEVTATATDAAGNTATCTFNVTVSDIEEPTLVCPANIVQDNDAGLCSAVVTYTPPVGVDNCEPVVTQSLSQSILGGNSVSCNDGFGHTDNSYMRVFDLPALGYTNDFYINSVDVGIEEAVGFGGTQPATVNIYSLTGSLLFANLTLLATEAVTVADQTASVLNIPLTNQLTVPAGTILVVEFFTPDGQVAGNSLFVGTNNLGQTGDTYLSAADCFITEPTSVADIGFPDMHWVLNINTGTLTEQTAGLGSGAAFPVGTNTETYQATDVYGNVATCSFDVIVNDIEVPTISCGSNPPSPLTITQVSNGFEDGRISNALWINGNGISADDLSVAANTCFDINSISANFLSSNPGSTSAMYVNFYSNASGEPGSIVSSQVLSPGDWTTTLIGNAFGIDVYRFDLTLPSITTLCGGPSGTTYWFSVQGENPVDNFYWEFSSLGQYGSNGQFNLDGTGWVNNGDNFVFDINGSSYNVLTMYTSTNDPGVCGAAITIAPPASSDNCPLTLTNSFNGTNDASDVYPVGTTIVTWTVTDPSGNAASCDVVVVVTDDEFPVFANCPSDIFADNDPGQCGAVVSFDPLEFSDNCTLPGVPVLGHAVPFVGSSIAITDNTTNTGSQSVSGVGTTLGTDVVLQSICLNVTHTWVADLEFVLESPTGDQITLMSGPPCGGTDLDVCFVTGTGNPLNGGSCGSFPAYSGDFTAESGNLAGLSVGSDPNGTWTLYATDMATIDEGFVNSWTLNFAPVVGTDPAAAVQTSGLPSGSEYPVGTTTNTFEITDASGNTTTCSFDVVVSDVEAPSITCSADIEVDNDLGVCGATVNYDAPTGFEQVAQQFGNAFENGFVSNYAFPNIGADNFVVADGECNDIGNVTANFLVTDPEAASDFDVIFYDDNNGEPGNVLNTVNVTPSEWTTSYQGSNFGFDVYEYNFNLSTPVTLCGSNGGTPYWVSVVANGTAGFDYFWEVSTLGDYGSDGVLADNTGGPWDASNGVDFVFSLNDMGNTPDNCTGPVTVTQTDGTGYTAGDVFPIGTTLQEYTAEDQYGNVSFCSFEVIVTDAEAPVFSLCPTDIIACENDESTTFDAPVATDNCPGVTVVQTQGLPSGSDFPAGVNTVEFTATDASGNETICSFTITVTPSPVADFTYFPTCIGEIIYFTSTASVDPSLGTSIASYEWEFNDGSGINTDVNPTHVYNVAGDYDVTLTVTTNWGCEYTITHTVTVDPTPEFTTTVADALCYGESNGSITVDVTVGTAPVEYSINGGPLQSSNVFSGLAAGNYLISVTTANGCSANAAVTVGEPEELVASIESTTNAICFGQASGAAEVSATGGTEPYSYSIDGGASQGSGVFEGLAAGSHVVTVTDDNGCTADITVTVSEPNEIVIDATSQPVLCNGDASGSIEVTATGGTGALEYSVDGGNTFQPNGSFSGLTAGTYVLVVRDENGCSVSEGVVITEPAEALTATTEVQNVACTGDASGSVVVSANGGTGAYQYSNDGGDTWQSSNVFANLDAGDYTITVQDANGCSTDITVTVAEPVELLTIQTTATPVSCNGQGDGMIDVTATGGGAPYEYSFNGGITYQSSGSFTNLAPGTYTVVVRDDNGCEVASIVVVTQPSVLSVSAVSSSPSTCEGQDNGSFTVEAAGGSEPYTYTSNGNSNNTGVFANVTSGTNLVTVTDASGCTASIEVEVGYTNPLPVAAFNWFASGSVVQFSNQSVNGTSYNWNFGDGTTSTDQNPVHPYAAGGTYTVTLIVTNACGSDTITYVIDTNNIGINDPNANASVLNVYPNPNHGQFTLNYTSTGIIGDIQVNVMTIEGKLLMAEQFTVNADKFVRNYSDIELAAGIYIVQFISQTGTEVKRITVDK